MVKPKVNILLIYTGGTIGMVKDLNTGYLKSFNFENDRGRNIQRASIAALNLLRLEINKVI